MNWKLLREFMKDPRRVGAVVPSSPDLAEAVLSRVELSSAAVVAEFGAGSGAFTSRILVRLGRGAVFFAVENNPAMARHLRGRFPDLRVIENSVENLPEILSDVGLEKIDCIISSLPWAFFDGSEQERLLAHVVASLNPGGAFVTYAYLHGTLLPSGIGFRKRLERHFARVEKSQIVLRNIPPAFVYRCLR